MLSEDRLQFLLHDTEPEGRPDMKRILTLFLTFLMLLTLSACGSLFIPVSDEGLLDVPGPGSGSAPGFSDEGETFPGSVPQPGGDFVSEPGAILRCALPGDNYSVEYEALTELSRQLFEQTDGRWELELYPGAVLGSEADTLQMLQEGALDFCVVENAALTACCEDFSILSAPFVFHSVPEQMLFYENADLSELFGATAPQGFTVLCAWSAGAVSLFTRDAPVSAPGDLTGLTLGVLDEDLVFSPLPLLAGHTVTIPDEEFYPALELGRVDGGECGLVTYIEREYWTVAPYYNLTAHRFLTGELVAANRSLDGMSTEDQLVLADLIRAFPACCHELLRAQLADCNGIAEACGVVFTETDETAFRERCEAALERYTELTELSRQVYADILSFRQAVVLPEDLEITDVR